MDWPKFSYVLVDLGQPIGNIIYHEGQKFKWHAFKGPQDKWFRTLAKAKAWCEEQESRGHDVKSLAEITDENDDASSKA